MKTVILGWHWMITARVARPRGLDDQERMVSALTTMPPRLALRTVSEPRVFLHADDTVAGLIILAESHFCIHAFPARCIVRGDLFSCKEIAADDALRCLEQHYDVASPRHGVVPRAVSSVRPPLTPGAADVKRTLSLLRRGNATWASLVLEIDASGDTELGELAAVDQLAARLLDHLGMLLPERLIHLFTPIGVTLMRFGQLGRLVIHTWPEHQLATIDLSCQLSCLEQAVDRWLDGRFLGVLGARLAPVDDPHLR